MSERALIPSQSQGGPRRVGFNEMPNDLYRAFDANGDLLYVGISIEFDKRRKAHRHTASWYSAVAEWEVTKVGCRREALALEKAAIAAEKPLFNLPPRRRRA